MNDLSWQAIVLAGLLLIELGYMVVKTVRRPAARSRQGYVTTAIWAICFFGPLAAALVRLETSDLAAVYARFTAAIVMIAVGIFIRLWALRHLGGFYAEFIVIRRGHKLVTTGPYRWLRHPLHIGLLLQIGGFALIGHYWWVYLLAVLAFVSSIPRELSEEKVLRDHFGDEYRAYHRRTFGLTDLFGSRPPEDVDLS